MMAGRLAQVLLERERLLARIGDERAILARHGALLAPPLRLTDRALGAVRFVRSHSAITALATAAVFLLRRRTFVGLGVRAFGIWRLIHRARVLLRHGGY